MKMNVDIHQLTDIKTNWFIGRKIFIAKTDNLFNTSSSVRNKKKTSSGMLNLKKNVLIPMFKMQCTSNVLGLMAQ